MALIVQKYGGTSVADADRMRSVAEHIAYTKRQGHGVIVVVSAMGKTTDNLIKLANEVSSTQPGREMDMLLTTGERISMALMCMALADVGVDAVSFTGSQAGIITDTVHMKAKILEITGQRVKDALADGKVCVIAGFQGVSTAKEITTLGRGGSDTTAVALAAAFGADYCEIYTDVTGVFSADPRIVPRARKLARVNVDEMLEMAATGGKVLALRSVEFASTWKVPVVVRSSFTWEPGTWVTEEEPSMEEPVVRAVTHDVNEAKLTVTDVPDRPGIAAAVFNALAEANVNVDLIVQNTSKDGKADISFTVPKPDLARSRSIVEGVTGAMGGGSVLVDESIAKVSIIGAGMKSSPGIAARMFATLADNGVNIEMISTSTIRTTCVVPAEKVELAMRSLHTAFGLDADSDYSAPLPERK